jgi:hypothetical protein
MSDFEIKRFVETVALLRQMQRRLERGGKVDEGYLKRMETAVDVQAATYEREFGLKK